MSALTATTTSTVTAVDEDEGFSCVLPPGASSYDFGARLSLYRSAPEQFVPLSEAELHDMQHVAAEIDAELAILDEEERDLNEAIRMENCGCHSCQGTRCGCFDGEYFLGSITCDRCEAEQNWADQLQEGREIVGWF